MDFNKTLSRVPKTLHVKVKTGVEFYTPNYSAVRARSPATLNFSKFVGREKKYRTENSEFNRKLISLIPTLIARQPYLLSNPSASPGKFPPAPKISAEETDVPLFLRKDNRSRLAAQTINYEVLNDSRPSASMVHKNVLVGRVKQQSKDNLIQLLI